MGFFISTLRGSRKLCKLQNVGSYMTHEHITERWFINGRAYKNFLATAVCGLKVYQISLYFLATVVCG
jgi:hypothetical protein